MKVNPVSCFALIALLLVMPNAYGDDSSKPPAAVVGESTDEQPWRDATQSAEWRADRLLAAMSLDQKIALAMADAPHEFASLAPLGIPPLTRVDASSGLRGDHGVTAFPVPLMLAATFDPGLAADYGRAIAQEARGKRWNVILGPTVDIARDVLSGRLPEGFGEDPLLSGDIGVAVARAMQGRHVIAMAKHFTLYQSENDRQTMNVVASQRTMREVYDAPFDALIARADIGALMTSYPKINGTYAPQNRAVLDHVKRNPAFRGYLATDYGAGSDGVEQFKAGIDSWALVPMRRVPEAFRDGRIPAERLDDATRRVLVPMFAHGVFDHPLPPVAAAVVTTPEHQMLAHRVAIAGTVLLKNAGQVLPLNRDARVALIGPAGADVVTGVQGSSYVRPGQFETPVAAISRVAGRQGLVTHAQGTIGDAMLPLLSRNANVFGRSHKLTAPSGESGWLVEYFDTPQPSGAPVATEVVPAIAIKGKPLNSLPARWSARWTATLVPATSGLVRFVALCSGTVRVQIDGKLVIGGKQSAGQFLPGIPDLGPYDYPLQGTATLSAGQPVDLRVEYSPDGKSFHVSETMQLGWQPHSLIPEAVASAAMADVVVVFVNQVAGEGMDRPNLALPGDQDVLIEAVSAANPRTIVVLNTPGPVKMPWLNHVQAVLQVWYPGAASGTSLADILYGDAAPEGRLPVTFPADETQGPARYQDGGLITYEEGVFVGYRYFDHHGQKPLFPFGHGLSYATFALDQLTTRGIAAAALDDDRASVAVRVRNTSKRAGSTVVQIYAGPLPTAAVETPGRKLVGFAKVNLAAGGERTVPIEIERRSLSYWDETSARWVTPAGAVPLHIGFSSEDIVLSGELLVR